MKISELNVDAVTGDELFVVNSAGATRRLPLTEVVSYLAQNGEFVRSIFENQEFQSLLSALIAESFQAAGLEVDTSQSTSSSDYVLPGQTIPNTESGLAVGGTVTVEDDDE